MPPPPPNSTWFIAHRNSVFSSFEFSGIHLLQLSYPRITSILLDYKYTNCNSCVRRLILILRFIQVPHDCKATICHSSVKELQPGFLSFKCPPSSQRFSFSFLCKQNSAAKRRQRDAEWVASVSEVTQSFGFSLVVCSRGREISLRFRWRISAREQIETTRGKIKSRKNVSISNHNDFAFVNSFFSQGWQLITFTQELIFSLSRPGWIS